MYTILLWVHLICLSIGGAASFGLPVLGAALAKADAGSRETLFATSKRLSTMGRGALVVLILTGGAMILMGRGFGGVGSWFWVKMILVIALTAGIVVSGRLAKAAYNGDASARAKAPVVGLGNITVLAGVVLAAVLEFG